MRLASAIAARPQRRRDKVPPAGAQKAQVATSVLQSETRLVAERGRRARPAGKVVLSVGVGPTSSTRSTHPQARLAGGVRQVIHVEAPRRERA